jgi:hypothetical protein
MTRPVLSRSAFALLALLALVWLPGPAAAQTRRAELLDKLRTPVKFNGFEADPKMMLQEALDHLADRFDLTFDVNEAAFKAEMVEDMLAKPVAERAIPKMIDVSLDTVLRKILARVPAESGVTYVVRDDAIQLTTVAQFRAEVWGKDYQGPYLPVVELAVTNCPLQDALSDLADVGDFNIVLDARAGEAARHPVTATFKTTPVDTAARVLADMAGLKPILVENVLYVTTPENAARPEREPGKRASRKRAGPPAGGRR